MAILSFEKAENVQDPLKRKLMSFGSGGQMIHCEIVLNRYNNLVLSSWNPGGVQIRDFQPRNTPENWEDFNIGDFDFQIYEFFKSRQGLKYSLAGLVTNMVFDLGLKQEKTFCSQVCYQAISNISQINIAKLDPTSISPQDLFWQIKYSNFQQIKFY